MTSPAYNTNSLKRYVNLEEELKKAYIGQYRKKEKKVFDGTKTLDRNYFSRIRVRLEDFTVLICLSCIADNPTFPLLNLKIFIVSNAPPEKLSQFTPKMASQNSRVNEHSIIYSVSS